MKIVCTLFILIVFKLNAQITFSNSYSLVDLTHYSSDITSIYVADLNNDGYKELIVGSHYDNTVMFYKNSNGDVQNNQRQILVDNSQANFDTTYNIVSKDIDNDGLKDIIVVSGYEDKLFWFKNLGNFNFSSEIIISNNLDNPKSIAIEDMDNDGDNDIVVGLNNDDNVSLFKNNGDGNFSVQQIIYSLYSGVNFVMLKDLDNNGFLDIVSGQENGTIYWSKNIDGINFSSSNYITGSADDGTGFDFVDINNDTYLDIVFASNYDDNVKYLINQSGNTFSSNAVIIDDNVSDPYQVKTLDFDEDGDLDVILSTFTNDMIGWYKNNNDGTFSILIEIINNISNPKDFVLEDLNNDGISEIITSSYSNNMTSMLKLSIFEKNELNFTYDENIINFYTGAANAVKIADLNNDGSNDIVSACGSIVWNENLTNSNFSSHKLISANNETSYVFDIEIKDINNDSYLDVIGVSDYGLEVYKNNGDETFDIIYSLPLENFSREIEMADINNDGELDILLTFIGGDIHLGKLMGDGNFGFLAMESIDFADYGYRPYKIKCGDIDNDGDMDIAVSSKEYSRVQVLSNEGAGNFSYNLISQSISTDPIDLADIDNDGDLDIITAGSYSYDNQNLSLIRNTGLGTFNDPVVVDSQSCKSIALGDINNDGNIDIIGTSYEYFAPYDEKIFCYLGNGSTFGNQIIIESLGDALSLTKNITLGDLDDDDKLDIASTYYFINSVRYFINKSTLSLDDYYLKEDSFSIYPNPSCDRINWSAELKIKRIQISNLLGEIVMEKIIRNNSLDISSLNTGIYIVKGSTENSVLTSKLIVE